MTALTPKQAFCTTLVMALVQFTNALEYMMINPIFPYVADSLMLPISQAGYVSATYTLASVLSGLLTFYVIDRLDKRKVLLTNMALLGLITALTPCASSLFSLLLARFIAGLFGGITLGVGMALLLNHIPAALRSKAIAMVLSAFSVVSIIGLPLILAVAHAYGWALSFWLVAALCLLCLLAIFTVIQPEPSVQRPAGQRQTIRLDKTMLFGASASGLANFSPFILIPLLPSLLTDVLHQPLDELPWLFFAGGLSALTGTRLSGWACGRGRPTTVAAWATGLLLFSLLLPWLPLPETLVAYGFMLLFLLGTYARLVAASVLAATVPSAAHRGGFNVLQNALGHLSATLAFSLPAWWLGGQTLTADQLMPILSFVGISALWLLPYLRRLAHRHA